MVDLPAFLSPIYSAAEGCLDEAVLSEKFHVQLEGKMVETRKLPSWDSETLKLFQKTYSYRNRYVNRLPYENSRVKLDARRNPEHCDYINASFLSLTSVSDPMVYIASQAPISRTIGDFWQMVSEQHVQTIVMLVMADGLKCERYWPEKTEVYEFPTGIRVSFLGVRKYSSGVYLREFLLEDGTVSRKINHYNHITWPDHDVPESPKLLMRLLEGLHKDPLYTSPAIVHCSAGVGRTGTFCVIDSIVRMIESGEGILDNPAYDPVMEITLRYRSQRISIVETFSQFCFIYKCILAYIRSKEASS